MGHATSRTRPSIVTFEELARSPAIEVVCGGRDAARIETTPQLASKQILKNRLIGSPFHFGNHFLRRYHSRRCTPEHSKWFAIAQLWLYLVTDFRPMPISSWLVGLADQHRTRRTHPNARDCDETKAHFVDSHYCTIAALKPLPFPIVEIVSVAPRFRPSLKIILQIHIRIRCSRVLACGD
jgi:hypothetical protein